MSNNSNTSTATKPGEKLRPSDWAVIVVTRFVQLVHAIDSRNPAEANAVRAALADHGVIVHIRQEGVRQ